MSDDEKQAQIERIIANVRVISTTATDDDLLRYVVEEVVDRALLYLNDSELNVGLERVVARVASGIFTQTSNNLSATQPDVAVTSISDNGQSVTYSDAVKSYLATSDDSDLFSGFAKLLAPYRRVNVVS